MSRFVRPRRAPTHAPHRSARVRWAALLGCAGLLGLGCPVLAGCNSASELDEDPPLAIPDYETIPDAPPPDLAAMAERPEFDPPLGLPDYDEVPPPPMPQMPPGMPPGGQMPPGAPIALTPGFMPDPMVAPGQTMGQVDASTFGGSCRGAVPTAPNHTLQVTAPFNTLRILVAATPDAAGQTADLTMAVRGPDGSFRCADDNEGLNPIVQGAFVPGAYAIYIGTYNPQRAVPAPYVIGFTELPQVTTASLLAGAQAPPQAPMQPN